MTALARGGLAASPIPYDFSRRGTWVLAALLALGAVMHAASSSRWERFGWAPVVVGLTVLSPAAGALEARRQHTEDPVIREVHLRRLRARPELLWAPRWQLLDRAASALVSSKG